MQDADSTVQSDLQTSQWSGYFENTILVYPYLKTSVNFF